MISIVVLVVFSDSLHQETNVQNTQMKYSHNIIIILVFNLHGHNLHNQNIFLAVMQG